MKCDICGKEFVVIDGASPGIVSGLYEHDKEFYCSHACLNKSLEGFQFDLVFVKTESVELMEKEIKNESV